MLDKQVDLDVTPSAGVTLQPATPLHVNVRVQFRTNTTRVWANRVWANRWGPSGVSPCPGFAV